MSLYVITPTITAGGTALAPTGTTTNIEYQGYDAPLSGNQFLWDDSGLLSTFPNPIFDWSIVNSNNTTTAPLGFGGIRQQTPTEIANALAFMNAVQVNHVTPSALLGVIFDCANCASLFGSMTDLHLITANTCSSVSRPFTSLDVGAALIVTAGTGFTRYTPTVGGVQPGTPQQAPFISAVVAGVATISSGQTGAVVAQNIGTAGSTGGSASVGYCSLWSFSGIANSNVFAQVGTAPSFTGISYKYACPACGIVTSGVAPISYIRAMAGGKHPALIALDGSGVVTATLAGVAWP